MNGCFKCGGYDHTASTCKEPCFRCNKKGHWAKDCPETDYTHPYTLEEVRYEALMRRISILETKVAAFEESERKRVTKNMSNWHIDDAVYEDLEKLRVTVDE
jgi:hypothetical protein